MLAASGRGVQIGQFWALLLAVLGGRPPVGAHVMQVVLIGKL